MPHDLILTGGRVIDPSQSLDSLVDVGFAEGKVSGIGPNLKRGSNARVKDVSGFIVTPGLIDLHTHVYWGGTSLSVDPDFYAKKSGVTTSVDTGSAGPGNFPGFAKHVIETARSRVFAYLHVSHAGIYGFSRDVHVGESEDMRLMDPRGAVKIAAEYPQHVIGIKVRVGRHASGDQGIAPLDVALQAAEEAGIPLMAHIDEPPPTYEDVLAKLRPGDVLTHAFRPFPNAPATAQGTVKPAVLAARKRGVLFDIGHGMGSFAFKTARAMLANGFLPDTIS
ncbi:MAG: amidohydrolase/deacetylase family metallohydrolase, partial [Alphaproteobacteria bacterium]